MLTKKEMENIDKINSKNSYGLSDEQLKSLINKHRNARNKQDVHTMELIEYRLTDINFHYECGLLQNGEYKTALDSIKKEVY